MKLSLVLTTLLLSFAEARWRNGGGRGRGNGGGGGGQGNGGGNGGRGNGGGNGGRGQGVNGIIGTATTPLETDEEETILFMREEEKLARDVYLTFDGMYDLPVFGNIARSEQQHMDRVEELIEAYDLDDPVLDNTVGVFQNPALLALYSELVATGKNSQLDALKVGALIEEIDIKDLQEGIEESDQTDIDWVYGRLLRASYNHLRAFVRNIEMLGEDYVAQKLSQDEVDGIVNR